MYLGEGHWLLIHIYDNVVRYALFIFIHELSNVKSRD